MRASRIIEKYTMKATIIVRHIRIICNGPAKGVWPFFR